MDMRDNKCSLLFTVCSGLPGEPESTASQPRPRSAPNHEQYAIGWRMELKVGEARWDRSELEQHAEWMVQV